MSKQNPFIDLGATIANSLVSPFAVFAKKFASFCLSASRQSEASCAAPTPATIVADHADSSHAGQCVAGDKDTACAAPAPTEAAKEAAVPTMPIAAPEADPARPEPNSGTSLPGDIASPASCPVAAADPALDAIRARIASLQTQVVDLETRKAEMEQLIDEFAFCQYQALGELVGEQLRLQHELLQRRAARSSRPEDEQAAAAAAEEYQAYQKARNEPDAPQVALADGEREELKALYRSAVMRCHPDRVDEAAKPQAHEMFLRTQDAYRRRDLESLRLISRQLAAGDSASPSGGAPTSRELLEGLLESLLDKGAALLLAIQSLQMQAQYRRAHHREQWEDYFAAARERLEDECEAMRRQLSRC